MADEFPNDLHIETDDDSDLVRTLRKAIKAKDKNIEKLTTEAQTARTQGVEAAVKDALKSVPEASRAKVEKLIRKDVKSAEDVQTWLEEYGDVFGVVADEAGAEGADAAAGNDAEQTSGEETQTGLSAEDQATLAAVQRTESRGTSDAPVGKAAVSKQLQDIRAITSSEEAFAELRKLGLVGG